MVQLATQAEEDLSSIPAKHEPQLTMLSVPDPQLVS